MDATLISGFLGLTANTIWPLFKYRASILLGQSIACTFMAMHYLLLGANTGALMMLIPAILAVLAIFLEKRPIFKLLYLGVIVVIPLGVIATWNGVASIFSATALLLFCVANMQKKIINMRRILILCIVSWVLHNLITYSIPGLISNVLAMFVSFYGLYFLTDKEKISCESCSNAG